MHLILKIGLLLALVFVISTCSTDDPVATKLCEDATNNTTNCQSKNKAQDITGNWVFNSLINLAQCNEFENYESLYTVTIELENNNIKVISPYGTFNGTIDEDIISWSGQYFDENIERFVSYSNLNIKISDASLAGTGGIEIRNTVAGELVCDGLFSLSASLILDTNNVLIAPTLKAFHADDVTEQTTLIHWVDNSINEDQFSVERSLSDSVSFEIVSNVVANQNSFTDTDLLASTTYFYRVKASNNFNESAYSNTIMVTTASETVTLPNSPSELTFANLQSNSVDLNWIDNANNETGFIIERSDNLGETYSTIHQPGLDETTYRDTELSAATEYQYRISAYNGINFSESSNILTIITSDLPPTAPTQLSVQPNSESSIRISWVDTANNEQNTIVERSDSNNGEYDIIATLGTNSSSYQDDSLAAETYYCYRIKTTNTLGASSYTDTLCATTNPALLLTPIMPTEFQVIASQTGLNFVLTWKDVDNESHYEIERTTSSVINDYVLVATLNANAETYADVTDLEKNTKYWYRLRATNNFGKSEFTEPQTGKSLGDPVVVTNFTGIIVNNGPSILFSWTNPENIISVELQRKVNTNDEYQTLVTFTKNEKPLENSYEDNNVEFDNIYFYQIITYNTISSTNSEPLQFTIPELPPAPKNIEANSNANGLGATLQWTNSSAIMSYRVERSTSEDGPYVDISGLLASDITEFSDLDLAVGTSYYYRIVAVNDIGESYVETSVNTSNVPDVPLLFDVTPNLTELSTKIVWADVSSETAYEIQYAVNIEGPYESLSTDNKDAEILTISIPLAETIYFYRMRAVNDVGYSEFTEIIEAQSAKSALAAPALELVSNVFEKIVSINWDTSNNVTHYRLERSLDSNANFSILTENLLTEDIVLNIGFNYVDSDNLTLGKTYYYRLYSVNAIGENFVQNSIFMEKESIISKPPFDLGGWQVVNGLIDVRSSEASICNSSDYSCAIISSGNGYLSFSVTPFADVSPNSTDVTIFTNLNATGDADSLDYYYVGTSTIENILDPVDVSIAYSTRKGLPTPLPSASHSGEVRLYQGRVSGVIVSENSIDTGQVIEFNSANEFTLSFVYDANATPRFKIQGNTGSASQFRALQPAITSVEMSYDSQTWKTDLGYIANNNISYPIEHPLEDDLWEVNIDRLSITVFANPDMANVENIDRFYGLDFFGFGLLVSAKGSTFPLQEEHTMDNLPSSDELNSMGMTLYLNEGSKILSAVITGFTTVALP